MIQIEPTPNPDSLKFISEKTISAIGTEEFQKNKINEISNLFNQFYESEKLSEITNTNHLSSKLFITKLFLTTSNNVMSCLGITPVNKM